MFTRRDKNYGCGRHFGNNGQGKFNSSQGKWCDGKFRQEEDDVDPSHDNYRQQRREASASHNAYNNRSNQRKFGKNLSKIKCYNCQKFGDYASDCPESNQRGEESNLLQEDEEPTLLMEIKEDCKDLLEQVHDKDGEAHDGNQVTKKDLGSSKEDQVEEDFILLENEDAEA
ncbi:putative transcription factor interactor and regulator CCHC(Zn) family [Helianthus anomalus]